MPSIAQPAAPRRLLFRRHSLTVRLTHWINVLCLSLLLLTGLQIFNAHPRLYWGQYGADADTPFIAIGAVAQNHMSYGYLRVGPAVLWTTGILGVSRENGNVTQRAFPSWLTVPSFQDLADGRHWHFFFAWLFVINGAVYLLSGLFSRHFRRDLIPAAAELTPRHLGHEIVDHARLRFPRGEGARHYNALQKLTYMVVAFILLPLMVVTGLAMSPGMDAIVPFLTDLFGGRPSARTLHFIVAWALVAFVVVHLVMVVLSGLWNNMRSMISGNYAIDAEEGVVR